LPLSVPVDGATVWVRLTTYGSKPFGAIYNDSTKEFTHVASGIVYPAWCIASWR
jgi:hypothetical protein